MYRVLFIVFLILFPPLIHAATIENESILVYVDEETGRIFVSTVAGKADIQGDEKIDLLFFDMPPSSYSVIFVNNDAWVFGSHSGNFIKRPLALGKSISAIWENGLVTIEQNVRFIRRKDSGIEDGILISYRVENKKEYTLNVGLRILFDTSLGENGGCHFRIPETGEICYETEFRTPELPTNWISAEPSEVPTICLRGVLKEELVTSPDKIVFANYRALRGNLHYYRIRKKKTFNFPPYSMNDSAVALYYNPQELPTGQWRNYSTIIGLCNEGEYTEETTEIELRKERVEGPLWQEEALPPEKEAPIPLEEKTIETGERLDLDSIKKELKNIELLISSREKINEIIEELNRILETDNKWLDEEEAMRIKETLQELEQIADTMD